MTDTSRLIAAWHAFCDQLRDAANIVLRPEVPQTALEQAEGLRYLTRLLRAGLERSIEFADPDFPVFYALSHDTIKIGSDNPDNIYRNAFISGARRYRVRGRLGTARILSFGTKDDGLSREGTILSTGEIDIGAMDVDEDGRFELLVSREPQAGNWLPMSDASTMLLVRETHGPRDGRIAASMTIECLDGPKQPAPLDAGAFATALGNVASFVDVTAGTFADWMLIFQNTANDWTVVDQKEWRNIGGDPSIFYLWAFWDLDEDEALVIESPIPDCRYWNVQVNNYWDESLDYRYFQIHHNGSTVVYEPDGSVKVVLTHDTAGLQNSLETAGHRTGALMWRWVGAADHPLPRCTKVRRANLN